MKLIVLLLICYGSSVRSKDSGLEDAKLFSTKILEIAGVSFPEAGVLAASIKAFDEDPSIKIDQIIASLSDISKKMDGLEKAVNDLVPTFDLKIEQAFVNAKVMEAGGYKSEIDRSFTKMKTYLRNLSSFENVTLKAFSSEMNTEALFHNYHDMFFNNKDSKQKSLFELLTDLFINEGDLNRICLNQEFLPQLQIRNYYEQISFVELKAVIVVYFKYYLQSNYFKTGNFVEEKKLFNSYIESSKTRRNQVLKQSLRKVSDFRYWNCYSSGINHWTFLNRVSQLYIQSNSPAPSCNGEFYDTDRVKYTSGRFGQVADRYFSICYADDKSSRRYIWIEETSYGLFLNRIYNNMGKKTDCKMQSFNVDFLAFCDDENDPKTERRFSTHLVSSDVQRDYIITGVRIAKKYKTIYLEVQQGKLRPMGHIDQSTISWKPSTDNLNQFISVNHKTKVHISRNYKDTENYVLTHVGFESSNNELFVKMGLTKIDFTAGKLIGQTIYLDSRKSDLAKINTNNLDDPIRSSMKHNIVENGFLHFVASSKSLDAGQSTVPYLDTGNVEVRGGSLLNGFGLHYKESKGYGGFIGLSVNVYNHNTHIDEIVSSL